MPDVLIQFNENKYLVSKAKYESVALYSLKPVVDAFINLEVGVLNAEDLTNLFSDSVNFVFNKMTGGSVIINGLEVERAKAIELIKKPNGYDQFIQLVSETNAELKGNLMQPTNNPIHPGSIGDYFQLNEDMTVTLKEEMRAKIEAACKVYAKSEAAKKSYEFALAMIAKHTELGLGSLTKHMGDHMTAYIKLILKSKQGDPVISVNVEEIQKMNGNTYFS